MKPFLENERSRCAPQVADHALDLGRDRAPAPALGRRRRLGWRTSIVVHQLGDGRADRGPVRRVVVAGARQRLAQPRPAAPRRAVAAGRSGAAAAAAPDCRARSCRICRDAGRRRGSSAAGDRRRRTATGRPCGRSARGRRRRRNSESPCNVFPPEPLRTAGAKPHGRLQAARSLQALEKLYKSAGNTNVIHGTPACATDVPDLVRR